MFRILGRGEQLGQLFDIAWHPHQKRPHSHTLMILWILFSRLRRKAFAMSLKTGDSGFVLQGSDAVADITLWRLQTKSAGVSYASSATGGFRRRTSGAQAGRGHVEFRLNMATPQVAPLAAGSAVTLKLHLDADHYYAVPAVLDEVELTVDVDRGEPIRGTASFVTDGAWTEPAW